MCGISGIVGGGSPPDLDVLLAMMEALHHRGPDGRGYYRDEDAALGHNRLAIVDTAGGAQPMTNEDESLWVTFNGEIFNYVELAGQLRAAGHVFRTVSDTEVIVHAWEEWGPGCFERFNGQWALALWDRRRRELVLSRDRLGVRPLFFTQQGSQLLFASEVKALFCDPQVPRELDPAGFDEVLTYWATVAPRTVFRDIHQLPPGHYAVYRDGRIEQHAYWEIDFPAAGQEPAADLAENVEMLRERIIAATRLRFERSDVPVGAYLSGGLDSSVTAGVITEFTGAPLDTFSLRFEDDEFDEGGFQRQMSERLGTRHHDVVVGHQDIADVFPDVIRHAEAPVPRAAPAPLFLLSRLVAENGYKVVVTGEGADEVLAGYDVFREARVRQFWAADPDSTQRPRAAELLYPWMRRSPGRTPAFAQTFFSRNLDPRDPGMSHRPRWDSTTAVKNLLVDDLRQVDQDDVSTRMPVASAGWDPLARAQWLEMTTLLSGYILSSQGDRMLMGNSVEGRFPFLDPEVVRLASQVPAWHKLCGLDEKYLLKKAFADLVPGEILRRPKQPYRAPDAASFFAGPVDWVEELTSHAALSKAQVFDPSRVALLVEKCRRTGGLGMSNTDNMRAMVVLSTQLLHHHFLAGPVQTPTVTDPPNLEVRVDLIRGPEGES